MTEASGRNSTFMPGRPWSQVRQVHSRRLAITPGARNMPLHNSFANGPRDDAQIQENVEVDLLARLESTSPRQPNPTFGTFNPAPVNELWKHLSIVPNVAERWFFNVRHS